MKKETLPTILHWGPIDKNKKPLGTTLSRINKVIELYKKGLSKPIIMSVGASYCGTTDKEGWEEMKYLIPNSEFNNVKNIKRILLKNGIKKEDIIINNFGLDTVGESYSILESVIKPMKIRKFRVITSAFHLPRCLEIYHKILGEGFEIIPEPAFSKMDTDKKLNLKVKARELKSLTLFRKNFSGFKSGDAASFEKTLYTKHKLYSSLPEKERIRFYKK
ncbi:MAG: YdcF family protein [Candidatus Nanoarchaeia archaeon]